MRGKIRQVRFQAASPAGTGTSAGPQRWEPSVNTSKQPQTYNLPKNTLSRIVLAHSFAEYDPILPKQGVFVETPAARAAADGSLGKCIFVGRRGSGKTAINLHLS